jgi:hypothetical protein
MTTKVLRKFYRRILGAVLPKPLAHRLLRRALRIPQVDKTNIIYKIANSETELKGAFRLLHDAYVREGYMTPSSSGLRVTPYHLLPETVVVVAVLEGRVIGSLTLIPRTAFGLPLEKCFDLRLESSARVVEISSLAVAPEFAGDRGQILFPLMKFNYILNRDYLETRFEVVGVNPKMVPLYEALLLFTALKTGEPQPYAFVNQAPVVPMMFPLEDAENLFARAYSDSPPEADLRGFFLSPPGDGFQFPARESWRDELPQRNKVLLQTLLTEAKSSPDALPAAELEVLKRLYRPWPGCHAVMTGATA